MASNYPGSLDSFDTIASDKKTSDAVGGRTHRAMHNDLGDAIEAVQTELGTNPSGSESTVVARLDKIEDGTRLGANSVGATQIANDSVDTNALADSAVTSAKIADGTITATDVAASTFAAFSTVGNLLTANQAGCVSGFTSDGSISYGDPAAGSFTVANPWTYLIGTNVAVTPGDTYTCQATLTVTGGSTAHVVLYWRTSGGADISSDTGTVIAAGTTRVSSVTAVAPPTAAYAVVVAYDVGNTTIVVTEPGLWRGAGGDWAMPGVPITNQGIRPNPSNTSEVQVWNSATATWITV